MVSANIASIVDARNFRERVRVLLLSHVRSRVVADLAASPPEISADTLSRIGAVRKIDADDRLLRCICTLVLTNPAIIAGRDPSSAGDDIPDEMLTDDIAAYLLVWDSTT